MHAIEPDTLFLPTPRPVAMALEGYLLTRPMREVENFVVWLRASRDVAERQAAVAAITTPPGAPVAAPTGTGAGGAGG